AFGDIASDDIDEVRIAVADGAVSRLQKTDGVWRLVEPLAVEADAVELSSITGSLATLEVQRVVDEDASDLAQYGLDPARIDVTFRVKGEERRLLVGERTPTGGMLYAKLPEAERVFLVSSFLDTAFDKDTF